MQGRITTENLRKYLSEEYKSSNISQRSYHVIAKYPKLLQNDYGKAGDCTITAMTALICYIVGISDIEQVYSKVEATAKKYFYNGDKYGSIPVFTRRILADLKRQFKIKRMSKVKYGKRICFNFETIKGLIDKDLPIVLSVPNDGRNYYKNHSVSICGYATYQVGNRLCKMLILQDNWVKEYGYIDYDKMNNFCSINYYE